MQVRGHSRHGRGAHRLALATAGATLVLIFAGGVVTNTGSALAVPDWPTTFGHNMFTYPWSQMAGGVLYEHSHRLLGSLVGMLTVALALWLALLDGRAWVRWLGLAAVIAVIVQGILGGLRVVMLESGFALLHACLAHAFLGLTVSLCVFTSPWWREAPRRAPLPGGARLVSRAGVAAGLLYLQIVFGALTTHVGVAFDVHLIGAALASLAIVVLGGTVLSEHADVDALRRPAVLLLGLLLMQIVLGTGAYLARFSGMAGQGPAWALVGLPVMHRVVGAGMLAAAVVIALRCVRLYGVRLVPAVAAQETGVPA